MVCVIATYARRSSSLQQAKDEQDAAFDDMQTRWFEDANNVTKSFQYVRLFVLVAEESDLVS